MGLNPSYGGMGTSGYAFINTQTNFILQTPSGTLGMNELILNIATVHKPKKGKPRCFILNIESCS